MCNALETHVDVRFRQSPCASQARGTRLWAATPALAATSGIHRSLAISEAMVKTHLVHVFSKLGVTDRTAAVTVAVERGLIRLG